MNYFDTIFKPNSTWFNGLSGLALEGGLTPGKIQQLLGRIQFGAYIDEGGSREVSKQILRGTPSIFLPSGEVSIYPITDFRVYCRHFGESGDAKPVNLNLDMSSLGVSRFDAPYRVDSSAQPITLKWRSISYIYDVSVSEGEDDEEENAEETESGDLGGG
jgi:hypothetical protein